MSGRLDPQVTLMVEGSRLAPDPNVCASLHGGESNAAGPACVGVRAATPDDLHAISSVHQSAFAGFFLSKLGIPVLVEYYRCVLEAGTGILLVHVQDAQVCGFVAGFGKPSRFYRALAWRSVRVLFPVIRALLSQPRLIIRLLQSVRLLLSRRKPVGPKDEHECYLSSLAVLPAASRQGIGTRLVQSFLDRATEQNASVVYLHTEAEQNEAVNRFYRRLGFTLVSSYVASGPRKMNEYRYVLHGEQTQ